jgi:DNA (cytosine-5)-methyltransferase 1
MPQFTFADLFAGIGGFRLAAESLGGTCLFTAEINKNALAVYNHNYGTTAPQDMRRLDYSLVPHVDLITAGFPCQSYSQAGYQRGLNDSRGVLFYDLLRYIKYKQPRYILLENVRNLAKHDGGNTIKFMIKALQDEGYHVRYKVLTAVDFGLPQKRERVYLVCYLEDVEFEWPRPTGLNFTLSHVLRGQCPRDVGYTLRQGGMDSPWGDRHIWDGYRVNGVNRRLTFDEAKIMQGFPWSYRLPDGVTDKAGIKLLGNAVAVPVATAVLRQILFLKERYECLKQKNPH